MRTRSLRTGLAAYAILASVFLILPQLIVVLVSFNPGTRMVLPEHGVSLRWYVEFWENGAFARALGLSFSIAAITTICALLLGGSAALGITRLQRAGSNTASALAGLFMLPLMIPATSFGAALFLLFVTLGTASTFAAVVISHIVVALPYAFRSLLTAFQGVDVSLEEAATSLGATRSRVLRRVILPLIRPGIASSALFCLIISLDEFTITLFVGGRRINTLPLEIFNETEFGITPLAAAAATILIAASTVAVVLLNRWIGLRKAYAIHHVGERE